MPTDLTIKDGRAPLFLRRLPPHTSALFLIGAVMFPAAFAIPEGVGRFSFLIASQSFALIGLTAHLFRWLAKRRENDIQSSLSGFVAQDAVPSLLTTPGGDIVQSNPAADSIFGSMQGRTIEAALGKILASPTEVIERLKAATYGPTPPVQHIETPQGPLSLSLHRSQSDTLLWRISKISDAHALAGFQDTMAPPALTVGKAGSVLSMNAPCRDFLGHSVTTLDRILSDTHPKSGDHHLVKTSQGSVMCRVIEQSDPMGQRRLFLFPELEGAEDIADDAGWEFFSELPVPLLKISARGEIVLSNRLAQELLNDPMSNSVHFSDVLEGLGRSVAEWLQEALDGRGTSHTEFLRASRDKQDRFIQVNLRRVRIDKSFFLVAVLSDATELKTLEAQFVQSQKMQAIGQLAGGVAHDFNNLLTAISGHCDLLLLRHEQGDPDYSDLMQIHQNANRAASLVGQLLAFSRKQNLQMEMIDLRDALSDLTHLLNRLVGEKITLELIHDPSLKSIKADKRQLGQVIMNLVVNARDAMSEGGQIKIKTETRILKQDYLRDRVQVPAGDYVAVTVEDSGIGIAPDQLTKIFEPFVTTKRTGEGTGLGLSTAYGIVKQTGGFIFVDSVVSYGTTFTLLFPAHEATDADRVLPAEVRVRETQPQQEEGVVLLVEDEAPVRAFASRALNMRGYTVIEADCAEAALEILEDPDLVVDIFVSDVIMPGMDGPSWVKEALKTRPDVKVVFVSGYAEEAFGDQQARIANSVFLPKPFSLRDLTATVQNQLH